MVNKTIIELAIKENDIDHIHLAKLAGFNEKELEMVKLFWEPAFNKQWMYLSSEIIHVYFGYKKSDSSMGDFYKKMKDVYKKNIDYHEVTKDHDVIKFYENFYLEKNPGTLNVPGNRAKYYIITGEAFKKMAMRANTKKGDETCDYFIKVETLCSLMSQYIIEKLKLENQKIIEIKDQLLIESQEIIKKQEAALKLVEEDNKWIQLISKVNASFKLYGAKTEGLYLGAHESHAKDFMYKFGKSTDANTRASDHSVSAPDLDKFTLLDKYSTYKELHIPVESFIHALLRPFSINKIRKEHFIIHPFLINKITKIVLNTVDDCVLDINKYITILNKYKFNYEIINNILENEIDILENNNEILEIDNESDSNWETETEDDDSDINDNHEVDKSKIENKNISGNSLETIPENIIDTTKFVIKRIGMVTCKACAIQKNKSEFTEIPGKRNAICKSCEGRPRVRSPPGEIFCRGCATSKVKSEYDTSPTTNKLYERCKMCRNKQLMKHCEKCNVYVLFSLFSRGPSGRVNDQCDPCKNSSSSKD